MAGRPAPTTHGTDTGTDRSPALYSYSCAHCGQSTQKPWRGRHPIPTLCSNACKVAAYKVRHPDRVKAQRARQPKSKPSALELEKRVYRAWGRRHQEKVRQEEAKRLREARSEALLEQWIARQVELGFTPCRMCGQPAGYNGMGRRRRWCPPCAKRKQRDANRGSEAAKAHWLRREARKRGVDSEVVRYRVVFDRDGWRCYLCGKDTPRHLRGTIHPDAPELEHVIPLSKGGAHSYDNTACACRACNSAKGDRLPSLVV